MNTNTFNFLEFFSEADINENLLDFGFFCGDFSAEYGSVSSILSEMGYSSSDLLGDIYMNSIHPEDLSTYKVMLYRLQKGLDDNFYCEYRLADKTGNWRWVLTQAFVIKRNVDKSIHKIIGIDRDITSQKNVETYYHTDYATSKMKLNLFDSIDNSDNSPNELETILEKLNKVAAFDGIEIYTRQGESFVQMLQHPEKHEGAHIRVDKLYPHIDSDMNPVIVDDQGLCNPFKSLLIIPLHINRNIIGYIILGHFSRGYYKGRDLFPVKSFSEYLSLFVNNIINKSVERRIAERVHRDEHLKIARELHDGIAQNLACGKIITEQLIEPRYKDFVGDDELIRLHNIIKDTLKEVRVLSEDLRHTAETRNLSDLIEMYCNKMNSYFRIDIHFEDYCWKDLLVRPLVSEDLLRIVQEGISNAQRHSGGDVVVITLSCSERNVLIQLKDNGTPVLPLREGLGIKGIKERALRLKGTVEWQFEDGTEMILILPDKLFKEDKK